MAASEVVAEYYRHLSVGDLRAAVELLHDDVVMTIEGPAEIPFAGTFHGKQEFERCFALIGAHCIVKKMDPQRYLSDGATVVVVGREEMAVQTTNRAWASDWIHRYELRNNRIAEIQEYYDTCAAARAFHG